MVPAFRVLSTSALTERLLWWEGLIAEEEGPGGWRCVCRAVRGGGGV